MVVIRDAAIADAKHILEIYDYYVNKFGRWYDMVWMEKMIGKHGNRQASVVWYGEI